MDELMVPRRRPYESEGFHRSCGAVEAPLRLGSCNSTLPLMVRR